MAEIIELSPRADADQLPPRHPVLQTDEVYVIFTTFRQTLRAAAVAHELANGVAASITVLDVRAVPYAAPVEEPTGLSPAETIAFEEQLRARGIDARVEVCLCRDPVHVLPSALKEHSLVVVGGRHRWWPTRAERWRRRLEAQGHYVVLVDEAASHG